MGIAHSKQFHDEQLNVANLEQLTTLQYVWKRHYASKLRRFAA
jgi:hypothetical protein